MSHLETMRKIARTQRERAEYAESRVNELEAAIRYHRESLENQLASVSDDRYRYRAALEHLVQVIRQNLGTHDHTDWELQRLVDDAEKRISDD